MCTSFTLHYTCTHAVTSHRCGGAAISDPDHPYHYLSSAAHHQLPSTSSSEKTTSPEKPCDTSINLQIHDFLRDICMACKLDAKMAPGHETGMERWADMEVVVPLGMTGREFAAQERGEVWMKVGEMKSKNEEEDGDSEMFMRGEVVDGGKK
jgi:chemotaxis receptor (MCP) glutamine deamidase CheD